ncbi:MAG: hypothetical protein PHR65_09780 [Syntrophomonadaceae bacterium]|nr:hypothetical protein [Syntrophomonadaceae bacterium]
MKNMMKILVRYVASAAGVTVLLLLINIAALTAWVASSARLPRSEYSVTEIADSLKLQNGNYMMAENGQKAIHKG